MKYIDSFLNSITMYRLTLYYLIGLVIAAVSLSFFGLLSYSPLDILLETAIAILVCFVSNYITAKIFGAVTNSESVFITALILVLLIPVKFPANASFFFLASLCAMGSKYLLTIEKRHVFNPAAVAVAMISFLSAEHAATWWIGTPWMMPFVLIGGLLLMRKIRREKLIFTFLFIYLLIVSGASFLHNGTFAAVITTFRQSMLNSPLLFFAFVMVTEPITSPSTKEQQVGFAGLVAVLYATPQLRLFSVALTPEFALCIGNIYSYFISPQFRLILPLEKKIQTSEDTIIFSFPKVKSFTFTPGQYLEWTLPHPSVDRRGNRRYFSIASSPTEQNILLVVKFYTPSSSYKKALFQLPSGKEIIASQLAGDFVLPKNVKKPLVFIAGGVGIAPFRSMIHYLIDTNQQANIVLLYANRNPLEIVFSDIFIKAENVGVKTIYTLTDGNTAPQNWTGETGRITEEMIKKHVSDYAKRLYYISGPQLMVQAYESMLESMNIAKKQIITDYFPGYVEK